MTSIRANVAFNLKRLARVDGLTQRQLAQSLGVSESRVSNWLTEKNFPEERVFDRLRQRFGWAYTEIVRDPAAYSLTVCPENQ